MNREFTLKFDRRIHKEVSAPSSLDLVSSGGAYYLSAVSLTCHLEQDTESGVLTNVLIY